MNAKRNPAPGGNRGGAGISNYSGADFNAPIDKLLSRLDGVREVGAGKWVAKCPAHGDKHPSLSIRELPDSRVLLHCFAGCPAAEVLGAVGLTLGDLFERPVGHHLPKARVTFPALPILKALSFEARVVFECGTTMAAGEALSGDDHVRLVTALDRIDAGLRVAEGCA